MRYLFVGAHPDDLEFGCGGTAKQITNSGGEVMFLLMTHGERGGDLNDRRAEQMMAAGSLGARLMFVGYPDLGVKADEATIEEMRKFLCFYKPSVVFTHAPRDKHPDHTATTTIVESAIKNEGIPLLYFRSFSSTAFEPTVTITHGCADDKRRALNYHRSQVDKYKSRGIDFVKLAMPSENEESFEV